ncbi:MAG: NADH-quinone oxidoreductase subunit 5 family protein, partial [Bacteroidia bacterium]
MFGDYAALIVLLPVLAFVLTLFLGKRLYSGGALLPIAAIAGSFIISFGTFLEIYPDKTIQQSLPWFAGMNIGILIDPLAVVMLMMVSFVSLLIHIYAVGYMAHDPAKPRYFAETSLFTAAMLGVILSDNILQFFIAWELVGLCSYLLIGFWYHKPSAAAAAKKAFLVTRVGDVLFLAGIVLLYFNMSEVISSHTFSLEPGSFILQFKSMFAAIPHIPPGQLTLITLLFFGGAVGKSGQFPLHGWLPDAMEGPTTVSALIHAATMVTAGIYLVVRFSSLITNSPIAIFLIILSGSLTTLLCSLIGIDSFDLKRIIASSTASQLGYMFFVCGLTEYSSAICHLFYHAFFKALLFLSAGVIIHSLSDEQDIRKMGGLVQKMPLAFVAVSLGSFALIGAPFIGGFYSKDPIIEYSDLLIFVENIITLFCCTLGAFNTTYYSTRLISLVFLGRYNGSKIVFSKMHDTSLFMYIPLILLIFFTCFTFLSTDVFLGEANLFWFFEEEDLFFFREGEEDVDTFVLTIFFILLGIFGFKNENIFDFHISTFFNNTNMFQTDDFFKFIKNCNFFKWFFDFFFIKFFVNVFYKFSNFLFLNFDRGVFEIFGPLFFVRFFTYISFLVSRLQTGFIYHYVLFQIINLIFFLVYLNNFLIETKLFLFFFLNFFGFFRFVK